MAKATHSLKQGIKTAAAAGGKVVGAVTRKLQNSKTGAKAVKRNERNARRRKSAGGQGG